MKASSAKVQETPQHYAISAVSASGSEVKDLCATYALKREDIVRLTGFSTRAVAMWSAGAPPASAAQKTLTELERLLAGLGRVMKVQAVGAWLRASNPAFEGSTPLQVMERGEGDRLWRMIHYLEAGQPG